MISAFKIAAVIKDHVHNNHTFLHFGESNEAACCFEIYINDKNELRGGLPVNAPV